MNVKFKLALVAGAAMLLTTSCGKKLGQFSSDYFNCNPNPLELIGETVPATVTGNVPAKFFVKNATVTVTPTLVFGANEVQGTPSVFQGENVRGNNPVINYNYGGTVTIPANFKWQADMLQSELYLDFVVNQGNNTYALPRVKVANGVLATADFASVKSIAPAYCEDGFQRIINEKYSADIRFLINQAKIRKDQLTTPEMDNLRSEIASAAVAPNKKIEDINISAYASPDGPLKWNTELAEDREETTQNYITNWMKTDNISDFGELTSQFTPEDWEGFKALVEASNIQDKNLILSVLSMYKDPQVREREIRNMGKVFEQLEETILPQLRYSRITASINVIGKSDAELNKMFDQDPSKLTVDELLYTATLTKDNARKMAIYKAATNLYPKDSRAWNNLGLTQYVADDYSAAAKSFEKAAQLDPKNDDAQMNLGLVAMEKGDYNKANQFFGKAGGVPELGDAVGVYFLKKGEYAAAARAFNDSKTNNAALAQILTKDYSKARTTLSSIADPNAITYYLTAVLGARTNNEQMVVQNLRQAIALNSALKNVAKEDLEFANYNLSNL